VPSALGEVSLRRKGRRCDDLTNIPVLYVVAISGSDYLSGHLGRGSQTFDILLQTLFVIRDCHMRHVQTGFALSAV